MPSKDFIPAADAAFHNWQSNLLTMITANKTAWRIPDAKLTALTARQTETLQGGTEGQVLTKKNGADIRDRHAA